MKKLLITFLLLFAFQAQAVVINEIAWMGTTEQWQNEWIELYNDTDKDVSLNNWILKAEDDSPFIELKGIIKAQSYFLLERTDDTTVPDIKADQIYKGSLSNNGEKLLLLNNNGVVEEIDCMLGWFAGSNDSKKTMERENDSWKTSSVKGGTPKEKNSETIVIRTKEIETATKTNRFNQIFWPSVGISIPVSALATVIWLKRKQKV